MLGFIYANFKDTEQNLEKVSRLAPCDGIKRKEILSGIMFKGLRENKKSGVGERRRKRKEKNKNL